MGVPGVGAAGVATGWLAAATVPGWFAAGPVPTPEGGGACANNIGMETRRPSMGRIRVTKDAADINLDAKGPGAPGPEASPRRSWHFNR